MDILKSVIPLTALLLICLANAFSMCSFRVPLKKAVWLFVAVTLFCLPLNSYIIIRYGNAAFLNSMIFTIALPYFVMILFITKDKISQTFFNVWLWLNIYSIVTNISLFVSDITFKNSGFAMVLRFLLFCGYFVLYHKYLRKSHRLIIEKLNVSWWIVSIIPMLFSVLIWLTNLTTKNYHGLSRNYPVMLIIFSLMIAVYLLIGYTFRTVNNSMEKEMIAQNMRNQMTLQTKQYELHKQAVESSRIFRHDQRFRDSILLNLLESGDITGAKDFITKEQAKAKSEKVITFCQNPMVNAVLAEYQTSAQNRGISFSARIQLPENLSCGEIEFCVMLSNLLENCLDAAISFIELETKFLNNHIYLNVKNDYSGELKKDSDGRYISTKPNGSGLGLKSVDALLKAHNGFLAIEDDNGVFNLLASMKN